MWWALVVAQQQADDPTSRFALQVVALITGGGIVQLIVFLLRRRSEFTALDKTASAPLLASANELIARLEVSEQRYSARVDALTSRLSEERKMAQRSLETAHVANQRLSHEVAQLRVDLDICNHQVEQLRRLLPRK